MKRKKILKPITFLLMLLSISIFSSCPSFAQSQEAYPLPVLTKANPINNIINVALSQEGYTESIYGESIYADWLNQNGRPWCSEFVAWSAYKAGIPTSIIPSAPSVKKFRAFFSDKSRFYQIAGGACTSCKCHNFSSKTISPSSIKPGDIAFIETNGNYSDGEDHTALVVKVADDCIYTIEGNTSDQVLQRVRYAYQIHGICRPNYSKVTYSNIKLKKTKLISIKGSSKDVVKWKTISGVKGYRIYRSTKKNGSYKFVATVKGAKKNSYTISNKSKQKYYYKVCSYNTYRGVKYRSGLSDPKKNSY